VAAGDGHGLDDRLADLDGQLRELDFVEAAQFGGALKAREIGTVKMAPRSRVRGSGCRRGGSRSVW
jgi:hypothetical protein